MISLNKDRRLGFVKISFTMLTNELEVIRAAFVEMQFVPVHIETKMHEDVVEYYGTSPKFRSILEGEKIPLYEIRIHPFYSDALPVFSFEEVKV